MPTRWTLLVLLGVLSLCVAAQGAETPVLNCMPYPAVFTDGAGGPTAVECPAFTVPGGTLTGVTLTYAADYQFGGVPGMNSVQVTFAPAEPAGVGWSSASQTLTVTGGGSSGAIQTVQVNATTGVSAAAFAAPFDVNVSSAVTGGTVATSSGAVRVVYTFDPPPAINLVCPASTGTVGQPYSSALVATGGVPPYAFSISAGSLPPVLTLTASTGVIAGIPNAAGTFNFTGMVVDSTGTAEGTDTVNCAITINNLPPPPPPGTCATAAAGVVFPTNGALLESAFMIRYASNLNLGDSVINVTNTGLQGASLLGPGFGAGAGNLCVNVYTFSPDEQLVSCCSCLVTPNGLASLSVNDDLLSKTLTGVIPTSAVVKLVGSIPGANTLAGGIAAWGTTVHAAPPAGTLRITETPFSRGTLSAAELASITGRCASILGNGSGYGICRSCRVGALGAARE